MKLLIITQKVDKDDPVLGFFHRWLEEFVKSSECLTVICLEKGVYQLPPGVKVLSLGKETGRSRLKYLWRFCRCLFGERKNYEAVFVHMNPEYAILGWPFWRSWGKPVFLWYNHGRGGFKLWLAAKLVDKILHTSPYAVSARFKNARRMPAGIDTERFRRTPVSGRANSLLYLGRIAPIKKIEVLLAAVKILAQRNLFFSLDIYGDALPKDQGYLRRLKAFIEKSPFVSSVSFQDGVPHCETPAIYNQHEIFVNLSPSGLYDKTVLEAMSCERLVMVSSSAFRDALPAQCFFLAGDSADLSEKLERLSRLPDEAKSVLGQNFRQYVLERHSLKQLGQSLRQLYGR